MLFLTCDCGFVQSGTFVFLKISHLVFNPQLSAAIKDREVSWKKQKSEIEEHYSNLIKDLHTRTQVPPNTLCLSSKMVRALQSLNKKQDSYLLTKRVGGPTDRAQRGLYVVTESLIFDNLFPSDCPHSVNKHFMILLWSWLLIKLSTSLFVRSVDFIS